MRFLLILYAVTALAQQTFLVKPYLQLGSDPKRDLSILWHTADADAKFTVQTRVVGDSKWSLERPAACRRIAVLQTEPHHVWSAALNGIDEGRDFEYQVLRDSQPVFQSTARARKGSRQPQRFVVFGDCGANLPEQKQIAVQVANVKPDFVFITGDIVYSRGRVPEYREKFFPIYNADTADPNVGAPLLRTTLFAASPGNHDIAERDFAKYPDTQSYYYYWSQPLNGPLGEPGPNTSKTEGPVEAVGAFREAAGSNYPRMANFSFEYGNTHWTVLDANSYVNWQDPTLLQWLETDLSSSKTRWRFVGFHQPGFNSSKAHFKEQHMRVLAPVFEKHKVNIVFGGHVHNYQRSYPMFYDPVTQKWTLDKKFDGKKEKKPSGVIYIVTGAGGNRLYNPEQHDDPGSWQEFTHRFVSNVHSFTQVDIDGKRLRLREIDIHGAEVDAIEIR